MSTGPARGISHQDVQLVQNIIERCLQLHMNQKEVVETLLAQAKIEPGFTELVWQKLEEENKEFFKAYYLRLMLKHQILEFNNLLEQQERMMRQIHTSSIPTSNGSHIPPLVQNSGCYPSEHAGFGLKPENMNHPVASGLSDNGGSSSHTNLHSAVEMPAPGSGIDRDTFDTEVKIWSHTRVNGSMIKQEDGYSGSSSYMFGNHNIPGTCQPVTNASGALSFSSMESTSQFLNEPLLDADASTFGVLDVPENYLRSTFLGIDTENFLDSCENEHQGDNKRLDSISEGLSFESFGSE